MYTYDLGEKTSDIALVMVTVPHYDVFKRTGLEYIKIF